MNWLRNFFRLKSSPALAHARPWTREEAENMARIARSRVAFSEPERLRCPDCSGDQFLQGPRGGACTNIKCDKCGATFNHCPTFAGGPPPLKRISDAGPTIWGPHHSYNKEGTMPKAPAGFEDKVGLLDDGWAVRFNGAIESARWNSQGAAEAHLILLQTGKRQPHPETREGAR